MINEVLLVKTVWGIPEEKFSINRAVFASRIWIGTNCLGDRFQSLPEFKLLKFGFRRKQFCLFWLAPTEVKSYMSGRSSC